MFKSLGSDYVSEIQSPPYECITVGELASFFKIPVEDVIVRFRHHKNIKVESSISNIMIQDLINSLKKSVGDSQPDSQPVKNEEFIFPF